jgi:NAD(P)H-dependent FMN reductase
MTGNTLSLAIIIGSTREGRFAPTVANWFGAQAALRDDITMDVIDLAEPGLDASGMARRVAQADAFVVITPEYNHSFPAPLKNAIDWHTKEWHAKPVGFVSYGGVSGGLRAVEHLRQIFAELHAVTMQRSVSFHSVWAQFDSQGQPQDSERYARAAKSMLDQLVWWARTLRDARAERPYVA